MTAKRTTPATARARADRAAAAKAKVQKRVAKKSPAKPARARGFGDVTKEDLIRCRDEEQLSWRAVAIKLELGSPGQARKAYTELTGRNHSESVVTARAARGSSKTKASLRPKWSNKTNPKEIREAITRRIITVERVIGSAEPELIRVRRVEGFQARSPSGRSIPLTVHFIDDYNGASRSVFVKRISAVQ